MLSIFQKTTKVTIFVCCNVLAAIFTSLAFSSFERTHWQRQIVLTAIAPFQTIITAGANAVNNIWHHYIWLTDAAKENEQLKRQLLEANNKLIEFEEVKKENANLRELLSMSESSALNGIGASVIASDVMAEFKTLTIDKGHNNGLKKNMVVIGPGGLVGHIGQLGSSEARILLISDPNSVVDVIIQRSGTRALLAGTSRGLSARPFFSLTRLEYLRRTSDVKNGDVVITSGLDRIFPTGIPVGTIVGIEEQKTGIFKGADVVPFVDLAHVKEVLVVK